MIFKEAIEAQLRFHLRIREQIRKKIEDMPDGNMLRKHSGGRIYYYVSCNGKRISLNHDPEMRDIYLLKEKLERELRAVEKDIPLLEKTAKEYLPVYPDGEQWEKIKSEQNKYKEEERKHRYRQHRKDDYIVFVIIFWYNTYASQWAKDHVIMLRRETEFRKVRKRDDEIYSD